MVLNKGDKVAEGEPKEMIDIYKRILVGQYPGAGEAVDETVTGALGADSPNLLEYGTKEAVIREVYITDDKGLRTNTLLKGSTFTIHMELVRQILTYSPR